MRGCGGREQAEQALEEEKEVHASALEVERTERQRQQHFFDQVPLTRTAHSFSTGWRPQSDASKLLVQCSVCEDALFSGPRWVSCEVVSVLFRE